jgi:predicted metal-dependent hydrolase
VTESGRDRDLDGRPLSKRPRDELGRPLPYGAPSSLEELDPALLEADPPALLAHAQRLLDAGNPFQAHEILEAGWKRAPEAERPLWRALAQLAVGITHLARANTSGAAALFTRSARELRQWNAGAAPHHIDVAGLADVAEQLAKGQRLQAIRLVDEAG